jgi:hypothetical protein
MNKISKVLIYNEVNPISAFIETQSSIRATDSTYLFLPNPIANEMRDITTFCTQ